MTSTNWYFTQSLATSSDSDDLKTMIIDLAMMDCKDCWWSLEADRCSSWGTIAAMDPLSELNLDSDHSAAAAATADFALQVAATVAATRQ